MSQINFRCNRLHPSFEGTSSFHKFEDWEIDATKRIIKATNRDIRGGILLGSPITKLYTGHNFLSSSYWREYPIAYGGRQVERYAEESVSLQFRRWTPEHWIIAMNRFVVRPEFVPYSRGGDVLGCITRDMLNSCR